MSMSDSTRDLYKVLQARARAARLIRAGQALPQKDSAGRPLPGMRRRVGGPQAKKRWRIPPKVKQYLPYAVVFLAILAPLLHNPPRNNQVPTYLLGQWKSETPGYEDRYLLFADRNLAFGTGRYEGESYIVAEAQASPVDTGMQSGASTNRMMLVEIRYMKQDRLEYGLSFYYEPKPVETITFKNQEHLKWTKKKGTDS